MRARTTAAATIAMLAGLGVGAAMAPVEAERAWPLTEPEQAVHLFTGGSYIGVSVRDVSADDVKGAQAPAGVVVEEVRSDSPAEKAGFREGDLVVEFDGERVRSVRQFTRLVQETPAGREVQAVVLRDGQRTTLSIAPSESSWRDGVRIFRHDGDRFIVPPSPPAPPVPPARPAPAPRAPLDIFPRLEGFFGSSGRLGITVDGLSDQLAEYFGTVEGVLVTSVSSNSAAEKAGVKAGDVIVSINGAPVDSPSDLSRRTQRLEDGEEFTLEVVRNKQKQTLKGKVEPRQPGRWTARTVL